MLAGNIMCVASDVNVCIFDVKRIYIPLSSSLINK